MKTQIDHLVVVAKNLDIGVQWCEATFGITPTSRAGLLNAIVVWLNTEPGTVTITPTLVATTTLYNFGYAFASNPQNLVAYMKRPVE